MGGKGQRDRLGSIAKQGTCDGGLSPGAIAIVRYAEASSE
jgi:hypothetical protein